MEHTDSQKKVNSHFYHVSEVVMRHCNSCLLIKLLFIYLLFVLIIDNILSRSPDTILNKETRLFFLQCMTCHSSCSVQTIKTGFQVDFYPTIQSKFSNSP